MKVIGVIRRIDGNGRIVIPAEYREELGLGYKDELKIKIVEKGILIKKELTISDIRGYTEEEIIREVERRREEGEEINIENYEERKLKITKNGRMFIPSKYRRIIGVQETEEVEMLLTDKGVLIKKREEVDRISKLKEYSKEELLKEVLRRYNKKAV